MSSNGNNKLVPWWVAGLAAAGVTFFAAFIVVFACEVFGVDPENVYVVVSLAAMLGVGVIVAVFKCAIENESDQCRSIFILSEQRLTSIHRLHNEQKEANTKITELEATVTRLLAEIEKRVKLEDASSKVDGFSLETIASFMRFMTQLHELRRSRWGIDVYRTEMGKMQDAAFIAVLTHLARCVPVEREQFAHLGPIGDPWITDALVGFLEPCGNALPDILKELAAKKNKDFVAVMQQLPPDIELYLSRLTLTHQAEQPKEPAAAS